MSRWPEPKSASYRMLGESLEQYKVERGVAKHDFDWGLRCWLRLYTDGRRTVTREATDDDVRVVSAFEELMRLAK